jgi:predicted AAA+ superfamily ATPase
MICCVRAVASIQKAGLADIFVTGSNARVFSSDLAGRLSGRHIEIGVHPLDEYPRILVDRLMMNSKRRPV